MSTFAVFGMTRSAAVHLASKRVSKMAGKAYVSVEKQRALREEIADELLRGTEIVQLSELYDFPAPCEQFKELCKREDHRELTIRARHRLFEKSETGRVRFEWRPYRP